MILKQIKLLQDGDNNYKVQQTEFKYKSKTQKVKGRDSNYKKIILLQVNRNFIQKFSQTHSFAINFIKNKISMSYKAVFQFILLIHDFKNIDLPNQGLVRVTTSLYQQLKHNQRVKNILQQKNYAVPHSFPLQREGKLSKKKIRQQSTVDDVLFNSKVIVIRYTDQQVQMDDFIQFRLEIESFPYMNTDDIYLQFELLFSAKYYSSQEVRFQGHNVAQVRMKLKDIQNGIFCYSEAEFKQDYYSKIGFTIYGQLMRFKFEKYQCKSKQPSQREQARSKIDNFNRLVLWSKENYLQPGQDPFDFFYFNYVKKLRHSHYLVQQKLNKYSFVKKPIKMKVCQNFINAKCPLQPITQKLFREYLQNYKPPLTLDSIDPQVQQVHMDNFELLQQFIDDINNYRFDIQKMKEQYIEYVKQKYGERVFKAVTYEGDKNVQNVMKQNKKIAKEMRNKNIQLTEYPCENVAWLDNQNHQFVFHEITKPMWMKQIEKQQEFIEQNQKNDNNSQKTTMKSNDDAYNSSEESQSNTTQKSDSYEPQLQEFFTQEAVKFSQLQYSQKQMLIVLCHGFQGSSYDMGIIHKGIRAQLPNASYLLARSNETDTQCDIQKMGEKLADEVKRHIKSFMDEEKVILNFVGHSMGGIIARSSLKHLTKYKDQLGFYCSLSSPHLGYLNGVDNKIKAGLWVLRKWKPIISLDQLSMQEAKNPRKTFLYKLSKQGTLKYFRKLIFFSSFQDSYVSWHSARVSPHASKNQQSRIQNQMVRNILGLQNGKNTDTVIHRLDINFNVKGNNIDSLIGRAAHINLIIQDSLFDLINITVPMLFSLKEENTGIKGDNKKYIIVKKNQLDKKRSFKEGSIKNGKKESSIVFAQRNQ